MPVGPDVPANIRTPLLDHDNRLAAIEQPGAPQRIYVSPATTAASIVPASRYPNCWVWLSVLKTIAVSDGTDWIRQDTQGAL